MSFGKQVRAWRKKEGITQKALAARAEMKQAALNRIELQGIDLRLSTARKIAKGLGVPLVWLLMDEQGPCVEREEITG